MAPLTCVLPAHQLHFNLLAIRDDPLLRLQAQIAEAQSKEQSDWAATLLEQISHENEKRDRWAVSIQLYMFPFHIWVFNSTDGWTTNVLFSSLEHTLSLSLKTRFGGITTLGPYMRFCSLWLRQNFLMAQ